MNHTKKFFGSPTHIKAADATLGRRITLLSPRHCSVSSTSNEADILFVNLGIVPPQQLDLVSTILEDFALIPAP